MNIISTSFNHFKIYSIVAAGLVMANSAEAQVEYFPVDPDRTITQTVDGAQTEDIDMNDDGTTDFSIRIFKGSEVNDFGETFTGTLIRISGMNTQKEIVYQGGGAHGFQHGETIDNTPDFVPEANVILYGEFSTIDGTLPADRGVFRNTSDLYIGVRFNIGTGIHYGYIGLSATENSFTIRDYGYELTADASINAGALPLSVSEALNAASIVRSFNNRITAEFKDQFNGKMEILSVAGQLVGSVEVNGTSAQYEMNGKPSGIYQVVLYGSEGIVAKKVFVAAE